MSNQFKEKYYEDIDFDKLYQYQKNPEFKNSIKEKVYKFEDILISITSLPEYEIDKKEHSILYKLYLELKYELENEWLNLSSIYNKLTNLNHILLPIIPVANYEEFYRMSSPLMKLTYELESIFKEINLNNDNIEYWNEHEVQKEVFGEIYKIKEKTKNIIYT